MELQYSSHITPIIVQFVQVIYARLLSAGVPLAEVRDLLGHSSITMTERYAHLAPENVRAAVAVSIDSGHDLVTLDTIRNCEQ